MKSLRSVFAVVVIALLGLGYFASQWAAMNGSEAAVQYAARVDQPPVQLLALVVFLVCVILPFLPESKQETEPS